VPAGTLDHLGDLRYARRALALVWSTSPGLTLAIAALTVLAGVLPAAIALVGQFIVDAVVDAIAVHRASGELQLQRTFTWVAVEGGLFALRSAFARLNGVCEALLRAQLGHRVHQMILGKALQLGLSQFEDSEFYDKLVRARRNASTRPLSLVTRSFGLAEQAIALASYSLLLLQFSGWAVLVLLLAGLPAFIAEAKFSGEAFNLYTWRSHDARMQNYLETVMTREDYAKEVKLYQLGELLMQRYDGIFARLYEEDRSLAIRRGWWTWSLGLVSTAAFYGAYLWVSSATIAGAITLGQMTMVLALFRQGQQSVTSALTGIGGLYEDNLYLSNLYEYLEQPTPVPSGDATSGPDPSAGLEFEDVWFTYPGSDRPALAGVSFALRPGQSLALVGENGSGKTTLIKLLTRLYAPDRGTIRLDGLDLAAWDEAALRRRIGVIFQDFARYQLPVGENVGVGDVQHFDDRARWAAAAERGMAAPVIAGLPAGYDTQLGKWFKDGRELSGGQWQKVALSRAFMREGADVLVLDEPTSAMDAEAEATVFEHVRGLTHGKMAILISHRFSTVRMADRIVVLAGGAVEEAGSHEQLLAHEGTYARLFRLQARGYA
jgi:ATP-binding cassette subfamily B protein